MKGVLRYTIDKTFDLEKVGVGPVALPPVHQLRPLAEPRPKVARGLDVLQPFVVRLAVLGPIAGDALLIGPQQPLGRSIDVL